MPPPPTADDDATDRPAAPARNGGGPAAPAAAPPDPFSAEEYAQFAAEDGRAGRAIGWLLCFLFVYTILVASAAIWWTVTST